MSELQIALIILGAGVVLALIVLNRRGKKPAPTQAPAAGAASEPAATSRTGEFDEFGVGRVRTRSDVEPRPAPKPAAVPDAPAVPAATPASRTPAFVKTPAPATPAAPAPRTPAFVKAPAPARILALYVAEREGTKINGIKIHAALDEQKLTYNEKNKAYDRVLNGRVQFSVTSLTAPGYLDRSQAAAFSTPGLGFFLQLPGPEPKPALRDMLATAETLAHSLKAVLFDAAHQPLTEAAVRKMVAEVDDWVKSHA